MSNFTKLALIAALTTASVSAHAADRVESSAKPDANDVKVERHVEKLENGGYVETVTKDRVDTQGTAHNEKVTTTVEVDKNGDTKKQIETEKTTDPKGLFNKTTETTKQVVNEDTKKNGYEKSIENEKTNAAGTTYKNSDKTSTQVDSQGNVDQTRELESSKDPKGLMNKTDVKVKDRVNEEKNSTTVEHEKKVNGQTVEDLKTEIKK